MSLIQTRATAATKAEAEAIEANFLRTWPPQGYDSRVQMWPRTDGFGWSLNLERFTSCD